MSQRERILDWLRERGREGVHSFELYAARMPRAAAVIHQLRKDGYVIESVQGVFQGDAKGVWYFLRSEAGAGVDGVTHGKKPKSWKEGAIHPGSREGEPDKAPLPRPGGSDTNSQSDTVAAPETLQLPLGDVPQAQTRRASYVDWDLEDVA